jgi:invasion protein IalB
MNKSYKYGIAVFIALIAGAGIASTYALGAKKEAPAPTAAAAPAAPASAQPATQTTDANTVVDTGWSQRCDEKKDGKKYCEVFARLAMKDSHMRVAEVTIGFPQDNSLPKGVARGVIIMPLGVLLESGATMAVDSGESFSFKSRFCIQGGCYAFVNLKKNILDSMKKGKNLNIYFKTADGHDMRLALGLKGFDKALDKLD